MRRWLGRLAGLLVVLLAGLLVTVRALGAPLPAATAGPEAEAATDRVLAAVNAEAWARTGAVRWTMFGHSHLWDRTRELYRLRAGDEETVVDLRTGHARAWRGAEEVPANKAWKYGERAYAAFINDAWWLNPVVKLRDPGVTRGLVSAAKGLDGQPGETGLLATWSSGGLTPGDSYLWWVGADGLPRSWQIWASILPIKGITVSWESWTTLATGARVATHHDFTPGPSFDVTDVAGAATLAELEPSDPFADRRPQ